MAQASDFSVVITRPEAQARPWAAALEAKGFHTFLVPLLHVAPVSDEQQKQHIKNKILNLDYYDKAIFVSQNAVEIGMDWLDAYWPQWPAGLDFFAVGATTAKKLSTYGISVTDLATADHGGMTSEDLLQAPGLQEVQGDRIIIFRGVGGRGHMGDVLRERGAWVDYCELYERQLPAGAAQQLQQTLEKITQAGLQTLLTVHSGESLENLLQLLQAKAIQAQNSLLSLPLLAPSLRVAERARTLGFTQVVAAENATDDAMSRALELFVLGRS